MLPSLQRLVWHLKHYAYVILGRPKEAAVVVVELITDSNHLINGLGDGFWSTSASPMMLDKLLPVCTTGVEAACHDSAVNPTTDSRPIMTKSTIIFDEAASAISWVLVPPRVSPSL